MEPRLKSDDLDFHITSVGPTTVDAGQNNSTRQWEDTLVSEGGIYEAGTGRAGEEALREGTHATEFQQGDDDHKWDEVVNPIYNDPLGLDEDP